MGCGASSASMRLQRSRSLSSKVAETNSESEPTHSPVFKVLPSEKEARNRFEEDGTLTKNSGAGHLALRTLLDEPTAQNVIGKFAAKIQVLDVFMCWIDIQEYKAIPAGSYRRSKALHIFSKYLKEDAFLSVGFISPQERATIRVSLELSKDDSNILTSTFYDAMQTKCFLDMYSNIFLPFKQTAEFQSLQSQLKSKYNSIRLNDFDYYNKLGEGGFGFVVHCRKKSTGERIALLSSLAAATTGCLYD
jgi:hypothetical protein